MKPDKVMSMLSIAAKAGKVASGSFLTEKMIKSGKAQLVILAGDASGNTKKKFKDACAYRRIPIFELEGSEVLGRCIGKEARVVLSVVDEGLAKSVMDKLKDAGKGLE